MQQQLDRKYTEYLVARAQTGDRHALNLLATHYNKRLFAFAMRLTGEREMARDAVQDAWASIVTGLTRLSQTSLFNAWAHKIVARRCADHIKKAQRQRRTRAAYAAEPKMEATSGAGPEQSSDSKTLLALINTLPKEQRITMALFYSEDFSVAEIAHITSVPAGTVKTRLLHARKKIRAHLQGENHDGF